MKQLRQLAIGRSSALHASRVARPQSGGKRPPGGSAGRRNSNWLKCLAPSGKTKRTRDWLRICGTAGLCAAISIGAAKAQSANATLPNLNGTYRCEGDSAVCSRSGMSFTVTQSGSNLEIRNEKGDIGSAKLTSNISVSAGPLWNMLGVIDARDSRVIQWSNGTAWRKQ